MINIKKESCSFSRDKNMPTDINKKNINTNFFKYITIFKEQINETKAKGKSLEIKLPNTNSSLKKPLTLYGSSVSIQKYSYQNKIGLKSLLSQLTKLIQVKVQNILNFFV